MSEVRRRLRVRLDHSLAYAPHAEASDIWIDAMSDRVMVRLQTTNLEGEGLRQMQKEISPERARAIAGIFLAKADEAEALARSAERPRPAD